MLQDTVRHPAPCSTCQVVTLVLLAFTFGLVINFRSRESSLEFSLPEQSHPEEDKTQKDGSATAVDLNSVLVSTSLPPPTLPTPQSLDGLLQEGYSPKCCEERVARCLACATQSSIQEYCGRHPGYTGCPATPHTPLSTSGGAVTPEDVARGAACLPNGGKDLKLKYPSDAEAHFEQIHAGLRKYTALARQHIGVGYSGPWIENHWITTFQKKWKAAKAKGARLSDVFGPYIPLLLPLTDIWVNPNPKAQRYPANFTANLKLLLRPTVLYIIVNQNSQGVPGGTDLGFQMVDIPSVLVLSGGGYGHVPLPLLKQPEAPCAPSKPSARPFGIAFVGTVRHAPDKLREKMRAIVKRYGRETKTPIFVGRSKPWKVKLCGANVSLCPRGHGRTSFRLAETMNAGRIPLFIYDDVMWVPYRDLYSLFGFGTNISSLRALMNKLGAMPEAEIQRREKIVLEMSKTHFSYAGVMEQVWLFIHNRGSDLMCEPLPSSIR